MKITKLGQSCLVVETNGKKILIDPGSYSVEEQVKELGVGLILITHEHPDHLDLESIKKILLNNPDAIIITNDGVGKSLNEVGIKYEVLEDRAPKDFSGVEIEACDCKHEEIFEDYGQCKNTAFFINKRLFHPGDSFCNPGKPIEILALPVAGPWSRVRDFMKYAIEVKPQICFPFHDGMLKSFGSAHRVPQTALAKFGIEFKVLELGKTEEF
jgi:L-ascorbate metabolism protein UlaG (beta-lactamase superfamily)